MEAGDTRESLCSSAAIWFKHATRTALSFCSSAPGSIVLIPLEHSVEIHLYLWGFIVESCQETIHCLILCIVIVYCPDRQYPQYSVQKEEGDKAARQEPQIHGYTFHCANS